MKKCKLILRIIILTIFMSLIISKVYAAESITGTSWENLEQNINVRLSELGYTQGVEGISEARNNGTSTSTSYSSSEKKYEIITWENGDKKYEANIIATLSMGSNYEAQYTASLTIIEKNKTDNGTVETEKGDEIGHYQKIEDVQQEIKNRLTAKGCPSENITDGYNNKTSTNVGNGKGVNIAYTVIWQNNQKKYTAYVKINGYVTNYSGTISIIEGEDITSIPKEDDEEKDSNPGVLGSSTANGDHNLDEVINEGDNFIDKGKNQGSKIDADNLKKASNTLYNILLTIGIFLAVAIGMYLGIKFMMSSAEDKAKVKESLIPYIAGCVVIFGAFIIWKLAITLLSGIA